MVAVRIAAVHGVLQALAIFKELDVDDRGVIDQAELEAALSRLHLPAVAVDFVHSKCFGDIDFDSEGTVSLEVFSDCFPTTSPAATTNPAGAIDQSEYVAAAAAHPAEASALRSENDALRAEVAVLRCSLGLGAAPASAAKALALGRPLPLFDGLRRVTDGTGANYEATDLRGADLSRCGLVGANFDASDLSGADLRSLPCCAALPVGSARAPCGRHRSPLPPGAAGWCAAGPTCREHH